MLDRRRISVPAYNVRGETRRAVIGATLEDRILFVVFTRRWDRIRVISARDAEEKRKRQYKRRRRR